MQFEEKKRKEKRHCHRIHRHEEFARHISYLDPSTHDGHSVRSRKYIERHIRGCGHVRIFVFGRDHVWIKWRHGTPAGADIHRSLRGLAVPIPQQLVARSLARGREKSWRASVCAWATYTLVRSWRGGEGRGDTWNTSRDTLLYLALVRHVCRCHRWKHRGQAES